MLIRAEQMQVFEIAAEDNFAQRLAAHLRENYAAAIIRLPDSESAVGELPEEKLNSLVRVSIERARSYRLTYESSIAAYSAVMVEVSPNFDLHRLSQIVLMDESVAAEARLNELFEILNEKNWETIRADYDVNDWQARTERTENAENAASAEFARTVMNIQTPPASVPPPPKTPVAIDDISFNATVADYRKPDANKNTGASANSEFPDTILNIRIDKE